MEPPVTASAPTVDPVEPPAPVLRTLGLARPAARGLLWSSLLGAGAAAASIGLLATAAWLISRAAQRPGEPALAIAIVVVQFCGLSRGLLRYGERLVGHDAAFRALAELRVRFFRRLEPLAPAGLSAFRRGDLLSRLVRDVDTEQDLLLRVLPPYAVAVVVGSAAIGFVWWLLPAAGAALAACLVIAATVVPWASGRLARRSEARLSSARGELSASVVDLVEGAPDLIAFGATPAELERIRRADDELARTAARSASTAGVGAALTTLLCGVAMWGGLMAGVAAVHEGRLGGVWLAVVAMVPLAAFELVAPLPVATQSLERARRAAHRLFAVIDRDDPLPDPTDPVEPSALQGPVGIEAVDVAASYPGAAKPALNHVDLSLPPGRRIAVVGPSGAGKSTMTYVLLRLLGYERGSVRLGPVELDELRGDDVRRVVGLVDQDAHLFDTSIATNLRIGRRDATEGELEEVMARVGLADWLADLPDGLSSRVGEGGTRVSGGQRRRLAVARALLADFDVLILDEPTEHLDRAGADALIADLLSLTERRTTLLVTHEQRGLDEVDEVLVVEAGATVGRSAPGRPSRPPGGTTTTAPRRVPVALEGEAVR
jgi:thiol reductant ABC exporter CydC subunit